jgi:hypothetical protein
MPGTSPGMTSGALGAPSLVQPDVLEAQIVVLAVVVRPVILDVGLPAIAGEAVQDDGTRGVVDQHPLDLPDDFPALLLVQLARLRRQQFVYFGIAILRIVAFRIARIVLDHIAVGVVDADAGHVEPDRVVLARELGVPSACRECPAR